MTVDRPPGQRGTVTLLACAPRILLLMGEAGASNGRGPMGTKEGKAVIDVEKEPPAPTKTKLDAGLEGSSLAPRQFTAVPVATTRNHSNYCNIFMCFRLTTINIAVKHTS